MSSERPIERSTRARPVADAPVDALLARAEELARRWAVALILARPLAAIGDVSLEELAHSAPALCEALARALASDEQLERFVHDERERARLASLLAASDAGALVADVDALRSVLWEATLAELRDPPARLVGDLADRLACVCATALAVMLGASDDRARASYEARAAAMPGPTDARVLYRTRAHASTRGDAVRGDAVLVDELGIEPRPLVPDDDAVRAGAGADIETSRPDAITADADALDRDALAPAERDAAPAARASVLSAPDSAPASSARATPRARPWDTPLSDEPTMRVRRGPGTPVERG